MGICINAYDQKNEESSSPLISGVRWKSLEISGRANEIVARSR
jgi:hypothetical protein